MNTVTALAAILIAIAQVHAHAIEGRLLLPQHGLEESLGTSIELVKLDSSSTKQQAFVNEQGEFRFDGLAVGEYYLEVDTMNFIVNQSSVKVEISETENQQALISAYEYQLGHGYHDTPNEVDYPLVIGVEPKAPLKQYYEIKDKGLAGTGQLGMILSNPLMLGGILLVIVTMMLPSLIEKLDPEAAQILKGAPQVESSTFFSSAAKEDTVVKSSGASTRPAATKKSDKALKNRKKK